jgi:hypothetical protein
MARGPYLRDELVPLLDRWLSPELDRHSFDRFQLMKARYPQASADPAAPGEPGPVAPGEPASPSGSRRTSPAVPAPGAPSLSPGKPAPSPDPLADLFTQLRETWPS